MQVAEYPDHWSTVLSLTPRAETAQRRGEPLGVGDDLNSVPRAEDQDAEEPQGRELEMTPQGEEAAVRRHGNDQQQPLEANDECPWTPMSAGRQPVCI